MQKKGWYIFDFLPLFNSKEAKVIRNIAKLVAQSGINAQNSQKSR